MSEETNSNITMKIEPIESFQMEQEFDDYPQVKQEFDDYENMLENDEVCLQRFLKSEVTIDDEIKQETIDDLDATTSTNEASLDQETYNSEQLLKRKQNLEKHKIVHNKNAYINVRYAIKRSKKKSISST
ncbi:uncharacterized protein LOC113391179 [Ctenocephalides felis]|uniref:uncharacterized protein LOC113391179 n=1 Tax=Ctenocephalides felis TaxID=7515 RepID=UPI000E6E3FCE|nr:uncharacterized protein LOC113391179 [Ctenocephalides felis]